MRMGDGSMVKVHLPTLAALPDQGASVVRILRAAQRTPEEVAQAKEAQDAASAAARHRHSVATAESLGNVIQRAAAVLGASSPVVRTWERVKGAGPGERFTASGAVLRLAADLMYQRQHHPFTDDFVAAALEVGIPLLKGTPESITAFHSQKTGTTSNV